ncbi:alpha/beta hydrolase family protein [Nonomuraea dietziae]|uniref:Putative dienelactone hydrolase n=1 Tax=Nonomuraea dietziae TaxID=65515 RepID=A0A7W5UZ44_9ACTN|nr:alpha/beta hydrolase [Nonomuraea dietziae]MBB3724700.1 putative dienelactone hydrolase [Nonomuraea dietziae]
MIEPLNRAALDDSHGELRRPWRRGRLATVTGLVTVMAAAALLQALPAAASQTPTPYLPKPTGSQPVGTTSLHLKDTSRPDPWVPTVKYRELMVSLWYPARSPGRKRAQYMTAKESELLLKDGEITSIPADTLSKTRTNAFTDARPAGRKHSLPLVVLSPGHSKPRSVLTGLAEELASRGYVVAAIDHTYENIATSFPDGRVATCVTCEISKEKGWWVKLEKSRAADVSFVLDQLTGAHPRWKSAGLIDTSKIGMAGQSAGGASTVTAMVEDPRLRAGIDMDGTVESAIPASGLSRPFLLLGKPATYTPGKGETAASWERVWTGLTGWKRWLLMTGAVHLSFTDLGVLVDQVGVEVGADIAGVRAMDITRRYVTAFMDQHLRNKPQSLLAKPSASYPEITFCDPRKKTCA